MESIIPKRIEKVVGLTACPAPLAPNLHGSAPQRTTSNTHIKHSLLTQATNRAKPQGTKRCIMHGLCSHTTDECRLVRQMVRNMHSSQSAANKSQTQTTFKGIGQGILRCLHILEAGRFGKMTHHVHPHYNQGIPGTMLAVTITHSISHAMGLIIHHISLHLTCRESTRATQLLPHIRNRCNHMTATAAPDAAYTPDIASALEACHCIWPPKHALMTERAETSDVNHKV